MQIISRGDWTDWEYEGQCKDDCGGKIEARERKITYRKANKQTLDEAAEYEFRCPKCGWTDHEPAHLYD